MLRAQSPRLKAPSQELFRIPTNRGGCAMKVKDIMSRSVETCAPDTDLAAAAMTMWRRDCGVVPVADTQGKVVGVITDRDICMAVATRHRPPEQVQVRELVSGKLHTVRPEDDIKTAMETMRKEQIRPLPVVQRDGTIAGMLSISDL